MNLTAKIGFTSQILVKTTLFISDSTKNRILALSKLT